MARRTQKKPEVPGAPQDPGTNSPPPPSGEESGAAGAAAPAVVESPAAAAVSPPPNAPPSTGAASQTVAADVAKNEELQRQVAATKDTLVGSDQAVNWDHLTSPARLMAVVGVNAPDKDPNAHLPHPGAVDWSKVEPGLDRVLTKQGWLLKP